MMSSGAQQAEENIAHVDQYSSHKLFRLASMQLSLLVCTTDNILKQETRSGILANRDTTCRSVQIVRQTRKAIIQSGKLSHKVPTSIVSLRAFNTTQSIACSTFRNRGSQQHYIPLQCSNLKPDEIFRSVDRMISRPHHETYNLYAALTIHR